MGESFLFVSTAPYGRVEHSVMHEFVACLRSLSSDVRIRLLEVNTVRSPARVLAEIKQARVVVVHSPLVRALPIIAASRALGAQVWAFVWDSYPVMIGGRRFNTSAKRRLADVMENTALNLCSRVFVPTSDFLEQPRLSHASVLGLWPRVNSEEIVGKRIKRREDVLDILFAGQVNETRGLTEAIELLSAKTGGRFRLLIASHDVLPRTILEHPNVVSVGGYSQSQLGALYASADFGLVSLAHNFEGPAFPSKTLDYVSWGLPIVYSGPALKSYLNILKVSKTGLELQSVASLDHALSKQLRANYEGKRKRFMDMACIQIDAIDREFFG